MHGAENHRTEAAYEPLLQFEMEMGAFLSDWNHCDQLSSFMARMISHNRTDPVRHSNFFSSALNELLEVSF
ncbi:ubiquinone biosynthesis methyltransferase UbiE, partial [Sinorhizobium medicae]